MADLQDLIYKRLFIFPAGLQGSQFPLFDTQTVGFNQKLADRDSRIALLNKSANTERQTAADLKGQLANAKSPEERNALLTRIADAEGRAKKAETESIGVDCSRREVPAYLLADLRVVAP